MLDLVSPSTAAGKFILFQVSDHTFEAVPFMPDPPPGKLILIAAGDLEIPIRLGETPKEALLRWKAEG